MKIVDSKDTLDPVLEKFKKVNLIMEKEFGSSKFVVGFIQGDGRVISYFNGGISDMEVVYMLQSLRDKRNNDMIKRNKEL